MLVFLIEHVTMNSTKRVNLASVARLSVSFLFFVIATSLTGCESNPLSGKTLYPVKGKVLLADGKPLTSGQVIFVGPITNTATIQSDGGFAFKEGSGAGLPEGEYKVRVEGASASSLAKGSRGAPRGTLPFDSAFLDEDTSGLTATVTSDEAKNSFEFKLIPTATAIQKKTVADPHGGR